MQSDRTYNKKFEINKYGKTNYYEPMPMITKEELKYYKEAGFENIVLDINKNPSSRKDFIPYFQRNKRQIYDNA